MKMMIGVLLFFVATNTYAGVVACEPWKLFTSYTCDADFVIQYFEKNGNCKEQARKAGIDLFIYNTSIETYKNADVEMELINAKFDEDAWNINTGTNDLWVTNWKLKITYNTGEKIATGDLNHPISYFYQKVDIAVSVSGWAENKCTINAITAKNILKFKK